MDPLSNPATELQYYHIHEFFQCNSSLVQCKQRAQLQSPDLGRELGNCRKETIFYMYMMSIMYIQHIIVFHNYLPVYDREWEKSGILKMLRAKNHFNVFLWRQILLGHLKHDVFHVLHVVMKIFSVLFFIF